MTTLELPFDISHASGASRSWSFGWSKFHCLEKLESLATGFSGVDKAYAIQAGREVRVIIRQGELSDTEGFALSRDLAKKIEQELTYPGQIKVTVIRENRFIEFAK